MAAKRDEILALLTGAELRDVADRFGLAVQRRASKRQLAALVCSSRKIPLGRLLACLRRDRLKEICISLRLGGSGRKLSLIERLSGRPRTNGLTEEARSTEQPSRSATMRTGALKVREPLSVPMPPSIAIGAFTARPCIGIDHLTGRATRKHKKPFLGIANIADLSYCEIQATINQLRTQSGFVAAAREDDRTQGCGVRPARTLDPQRRALLQSAAAAIAAIPNQSWDVVQMRGSLVEELETESLPSERRHWDFGDFIVIGIPDGIGDGVAVEISSSQRPGLSVRTKAIQANLYAVFWGLPRYHAISVDPRNNSRSEIQGKVDVAGAERKIARAWALLSGREQPRPPAILINANHVERRTLVRTSRRDASQR
jgi:hypothetical protein